jgi:hypothetical protein
MTRPNPQLNPGNEKKPDYTGLSPNFWLRQGGRPYKPKDYPKQEDWESVARKFNVAVRELIVFNCLTTDPKVVNWCLRNYTGCVKPSRSGNNWMFSNKARPGIIYIPPPDDETIDSIRRRFASGCQAK